MELMIWGHAIVNFDMTGQLLLEPQIEFSCFWNTRWLNNEEQPQTDHDAIDSNGNINPTGYSLLIWNKFMGDKMIKSESKRVYYILCELFSTKGSIVCVPY